MGMQKMGLLAHESIYWINMNADKEDMVKIATYVLISRKHNLRMKYCHPKYQGGHGNLSELTSLPLITSTVIAL